MFRPSHPELPASRQAGFQGLILFMDAETSLRRELSRTFGMTLLRLTLFYLNRKDYYRNSKFKESLLDAEYGVVMK